MPTNHRITQIEDYAQYVDDVTIERIQEKARSIAHLHITNVSSTYYGGGVAELLSSLTLLMNSAGIKTGWRVVQGASDYFGVTKKMHNALQGGKINLSDRKKQIYEEVVYENAVRNHLDHDRVIIHDPQPLPMVMHYQKRGPWIWHCHVDMSQPDRDLWHYLRPFVEHYDAAVFSLEEYAQALDTPQVFMMPAIDPFIVKNKALSDAEIQERLNHYDIPTDLPIVTQISRFDRWKDPEGAIKAFQIAQQEVDATLVLLGEIAADDPEGDRVYNSLLEYQNERIILLAKEDTALVNALQSRAAVVLQKSIREGFGLTVTEAMWKGAAVVGGNVGGIRYQIEDGKNGFLVDSVEQTAERIVELVQNQDLRQRLGENARETVRDNFLMIRLLEQYIDILGGFETQYQLTATPSASGTAL
ncbi:MAG: glycosyltransferase [Chloroflexi bacterium]|nr:glycosyltransferase [Chloroflexota bacterium]